MRTRPAAALVALLLPLGAWTARAEPGDAERLRFRVRLAPEAAPRGAGGRLFILMADARDGGGVLRTGFLPGGTWIAAQDVRHLLPGDTVLLDPDALAFPGPFSGARPGSYRAMALLDPDRSYPHANRDAGDLYGPVVELPALEPARGGTVSLSLETVTRPPPAPPESPGVSALEFVSPLLSQFWGRPIRMRAVVVLPPAYQAEAERRFPTVYRIPGFGGSHREGHLRGPALVRLMAEGKRAPMAHAFLDGSCPGGHHAFADSVNNGPWGRALVEELIPHLESRIRLDPRPAARFLTGHSSGGWSSLWLQVTYPDRFGGTWSTAPDPVDFRSFSGVDVTPGSPENVYRDQEGRPRNLVRGARSASFEEFARYEQVLGDCGGQLASFEWVFSPRGPDGRPMALFNRATGKQDPEVQRAWQAYDIRAILERRWAELGARLQGKLHVFCGAEDNYHLEKAVALLAGFLLRAGSDGAVEIIPGRDHGSLFAPHERYPDGLAARIDREMAEAYRAAGG